MDPTIRPPILITKLSLPQTRALLVERNELLERMNNCQDCKVTLISASAGFGKTTLIIEWILLNNLPVSWLSLDKDDNDPVRFLNYFIAALRRINPEFGGDILDYLELTTTTELEPVLIGLINEIAESFPQFLLVLDDYHLIESRYIHDLIIFLIENQPNQMHITVSTRSDPPWPLARLRVRGEITEIRIDDLRFTENEVAEFFNDVMGMNLSDSELISIYKRTEGWAAGLQMLALSLKSREDVTRFIHSFTGSHRFILDYLVEEVLNNQSPKIQDFLIKSSILERMNGKLCDAVIDSEDSWEVLNYLDRENLFIIPLDHERNWYRYHPLFKDLLNNQLEQRSPEQTRELNLRASNWFEREGYIEDAIKHAFHAKYYIKSADLVEHYAPLLISDGKLVTLNRWLELFPDWIFNKRPWLCIYQGWIRYWIGYRDQVEECLEKAEGILNKIQAVGYPEPVIADLPPLTESESEHIQGHIASIRSYNAIANERINYAMEMALKALELLPEWDFMRLTNAITLGGVYWGLGDVVASKQAFAEAKWVATEFNARPFIVSATCYLGEQEVKQGNLTAALETFQDALEQAKGSDGRYLIIAGFPYVKLGRLYLEWNELDKSETFIKEGLLRCKKFGNVDFIAEGLIWMANLEVVKGDYAKARDYLLDAGQLAEISNLDPWLVCWIDECRLRGWLKTGKLSTAVEWAEKSGLSLDGELNYLHDLDHINLARVLIAQGLQNPNKPFMEQAISLLTRLQISAAKAGWVNEEIKILVLKSIAQNAIKQVDEARLSLSQSLRLGITGGYRRVFINEGELIIDLLGLVSAADIPTAYINTLRRDIQMEIQKSRGESRPIDDVSASPLLIDPLSERESQVLRYLGTELSIPEIADELYIAVSTVRSHIKSIYSKVDVHSRQEAIVRAKELGLI